MTRLIVINGLGGSGKSTFSAYCQEWVEKNYTDYRVKELSTVDKIKDIARYAGWTGGKDTKDREFLSDLKFCLAKWNNLPIESVFNAIDTYSKSLSQYNWIFFINSREPVDHEQIYKKAEERNLPIMKILISNKNAPVVEVPELIDDILNMEYDAIIHNNGNLSDLRTTAAHFMHDVINGNV